MSAATDARGTADDRDFERRMLGNFVGMLRWPQFDALWQRLRRSPGGWYVSRPDQPAPVEPADPARFASLLDDLEALLRRELGSEYCGVVYADDPDDPGFVKIFDPRTLGSMCAGRSAPTPPAWVLSRCRPAPFPAPPAGEARRSGWWARWRER